MESTARLRLDLIMDGYEERPPSPAAASIDAGAAAGATCEACGYVGLTYRPFVRRQPRSYRAFAVCEACGHTSEF